MGCCGMKRALCLLCFVSSIVSAQVRVEKLVVGPGETFRINNSDILVADTLVMLDSSRIVLNKLRPENYLRARVAIVGNRCMIDGRGPQAKAGRTGAAGSTAPGPCRNGTNGASGGRGLDGPPGIDLFIYIDSIAISGKLIIDLSGGNGGDGGNGGIGGGGSPGTMHCNGGDGGRGGNGGNGGNGGHGGTLTIGGNNVEGLRSMLREKIVVKNKGGSFGYGGMAGYGGAAGLGPRGKNGKTGAVGYDGEHGQPAANGTVLFEDR